MRHGALLLMQAGYMDAGRENEPFDFISIVDGSPAYMTGFVFYGKAVVLHVCA